MIKTGFYIHSSDYFSYNSAIKVKAHEKSNFIYMPFYLFPIASCRKRIYN